MWNDTQSYGKDLGELVEYERGSIFGGLLTLAVFVGFSYLLWSDITINLSDKLYTFTVRDKLMSEEECSNTEINLEAYNQSFNVMFGFDPVLPADELEAFDPLDNDYVTITVYERDSATVSQEDNGGKANVVKHKPEYELERCP